MEHLNKAERRIKKLENPSVRLMECCAAGARLSCEGACGLCMQSGRVSAGGSGHSVAGRQASRAACTLGLRAAPHHLPGSYHLRSSCGRLETAGKPIPSLSVSLGATCGRLERARAYPLYLSSHLLLVQWVS